jgi:hypothetical protein
MPRGLALEREGFQPRGYEFGHERIGASLYRTSLQFFHSVVEITPQMKNFSYIIGDSCHLKESFLRRIKFFSR